MAAPPTNIEYVAPILAVVNIAVCLPLVLRKVPPNHFYGFRTCKTLSNRNIWYQANYTGGQNMIVATVIAIIGFAVVFAKTNGPVAGEINLGLISGAVLIACLVTLLQVRKM